MKRTVDSNRKTFCQRVVQKCFGKRKMKTVSLLLICLSVIMAGCKKDLESNSISNKNNNNLLKSSAAQSTLLIANQSENAGTLSFIYNSTGDQLTIIYSTVNTTYCLFKTHLDVQTDPLNFPQTNSGNPKVGQFAYSASLNCSSEWTQVINLNTISGWNPGATLFVAAHAEVKKDQGGMGSAWGQGLPFPGNSWAMYCVCYPPLLASLTATPDSVFPGQPSQLTVNVSGGTGTYVYSWSSIPVGFTSQLQNPIVNPLVTTTYVCAVNSGMQSTDVNAMVTVDSSALAVGNQYQGGIVGYIFQPNDMGFVEGEIHGLIVAPNDFSEEAQWGCYETFLGATGLEVGTGQANTEIIVNGCNEPLIGARLCYDLELNGYTDWFLPSFREMFRIYWNKDIIGGFNHPAVAYMTSTEANTPVGRNWKVITGDYRGKNGYCWVRAVRYF